MYLLQQFRNTDPCVAQSVMHEHTRISVVSVYVDGFRILRPALMCRQALSRGMDDMGRVPTGKRGLADV